MLVSGQFICMLYAFAIVNAKPRFRIKMPEGISGEWTQNTGIRQGCPLSPYLYIIANSFLMPDFPKDFNRLIHQTPEGTQYPTLLFADGTLLLTNTAKKMSIAPGTYHRPQSPV